MSDHRDWESANDIELKRAWAELDEKNHEITSLRQRAEAAEKRVAELENELYKLKTT